MFLKMLDRACGLSMMARPRGQLAIAEGAQFPADRLRADRDAELFPDPLRQIDQPPAYHAIHRGYRSALDDRGQRLPLHLV